MGKSKASWAPPSARLLGGGGGWRWRTHGAWDRSLAQPSSPLAHGTRVTQDPRVSPSLPPKRAGVQEGAPCSFLVSEPTGPPPGPCQEGLGDLETLQPTANGCHPAHRATGTQDTVDPRQGSLVSRPVPVAPTQAPWKAASHLTPQLHGGESSCSPHFTGERAAAGT